VTSLASLFITAVELTGLQRLALMFPLCFSIAVVYKTIRCRHLSEVPVSALLLWITIVVAMYVVGVALWALFSVMA
jgi:hypothetical protein